MHSYIVEIIKSSMHANTCRFSIGASKWQVQFMQKQDNEVRDTLLWIAVHLHIVHVCIYHNGIGQSAYSAC